VIRQSLAGRCILIVEDEPLVALHVIDAVNRAGAIIRVTYSLREAAVLVEADDLSAAILDYRVGDGDSSLLCQRLRERGVPFLIYSGYTEFSEACKDAPRLPKPTTDATLVAALEGLLSGPRETSVSTDRVGLAKEARRSQPGAARGHRFPCSSSA